MMPNRSMFVLGVTGGIASGKSAVSQYMASLGIPIVDADVASRLAVTPGSPGNAALRDAFGDEYFLSDGSLDRKKLARLAFSDENKLKKLNDTLFPYILNELQTQLDKLCHAGKKIAVLDVPLMFESGADRMADEVLCVTAPTEVRIDRIMRRDNATREEALARIRAQMDDAERQKRSSVVIDNIGSIDDLHRMVDMLLLDRGLIKNDT